MGPVRYTLNEAVLHWIVMDIIDVPLEIAIIADCVFPESTLPKRGLAVGMPAKRHTG